VLPSAACCLRTPPDELLPASTDINTLDLTS
jgi:hypothetical protein